MYHLSYSCEFNLLENPSLQKSKYKIPNNYGRYSYVEQYKTKKLLIQRIDSIYNQTIKNFLDLKVDIFSNQCSFREYTTWNINEEPLDFGISPYGWKISLFFFHFLDEYFKKHYGEEKFRIIMKEKTKQNQVCFYPEPNVESDFVSARELISRETAIVILESFLDGKDERDLDPNIYYQEIEKRNYLN